MNSKLLGSHSPSMLTVRCRSCIWPPCRAALSLLSQWRCCVCFVIFFTWISLVPAHPGCPGQNPQSRKMVVCVCVSNEYICRKSIIDRRQRLVCNQQWVGYMLIFIVKHTCNLVGIAAVFSVPTFSPFSTTCYRANYVKTWRRLQCLRIRFMILALYKFLSICITSQHRRRRTEPHPTPRSWISAAWLSRCEWIDKCSHAQCM